MKFIKCIVVVFLVYPLALLAAPKNWTLPATLYRDGVTTVGGTFTYDETTGLVTTPNIVASGTDAAAINQSFTFAGAQNTTYAFFQSAATVSGTPICLAIQMAGSDSSVGSYSTSFVYLYTASSLFSGLCGPSGSGPSPVAAVLSTTAPAPATIASVPTLSEWAMIIMASLMALFTISRIHKKG